MGILLCEQNFRDVWRRNESVREEIGKMLHTHTHTTHTRGSISSKDTPARGDVNTPNLVYKSLDVGTRYFSAITNFVIGMTLYWGML